MAPLYLSLQSWRRKQLLFLAVGDPKARTIIVFRLPYLIVQAFESCRRCVQGLGTWRFGRRRDGYFRSIFRTKCTNFPYWTWQRQRISCMRQHNTKAKENEPLGDGECRALPQWHRLRCCLLTNENFGGEDKCAQQELLSYIVCVRAFLPPLGSILAPHDPQSCSLTFKWNRHVIFLFS